MKISTQTKYMERNPARIGWIDSLYVYGMVLVVLGHVILTDADKTTYLHHWIYGFHMSLFFWIAGVLFKWNGCIVEFVIKKTKRLLVPLVVLTCIAYFPKYLLSDFAMHPLGHRPNLISGLLVAIIYPSENPIILMWFLNALFVVYLIGFGLVRVIKDNWILWLVAGIVFSQLSSFVPDISFFGISKAIGFFPYFCLGIISKKAIARLEMAHKLKSNPLLFLFIISTAVYGVLVCFPTDIYIKAIIGIFAAFAMMKFLAEHKIQFLPSLRKYTFTIYLLQWFPMVAARIALFQVLDWNKWVCYVVMFLSGLLIPVLVGKLLLYCVPRRGLGKYILLSVGL